MSRVDELKKKLEEINEQLQRDLSPKQKKRLMKGKMRLEGRIREASRSPLLKEPKE